MTSANSGTRQLVEQLSCDGAGALLPKEDHTVCTLAEVNMETCYNPTIRLVDAAVLVKVL